MAINTGADCHHKGYSTDLYMFVCMYENGGKNHNKNKGLSSHTRAPTYASKRKRKERNYNSDA